MKNPNDPQMAKPFKSLKNQLRLQLAMKMQHGRGRGDQARLTRNSKLVLVAGFESSDRLKVENILGFLQRNFLDTVETSSYQGAYR